MSFAFGSPQPFNENQIYGQDIKLNNCLNIDENQQNIKED
jgi:hypothetical protein